MTSSPTTSGPVGRSQLIGSPEGRGAIGPPAAAVVLLPLPASLMAPRIARDDFPLFLELVFAKLNPGIPLARGWYLSAMTQALAEVESGAVRRLQITVPPRHLKSIMVSIAYPAWLLGRRPATRIICASYSQDLATALARSFRDIVTAPWYARVFPETAASIVRATDTEVHTRQHGYRYAVGLGGTVTGLGADLIIIDDLMKAQDASFPEARARAKRFVDETLLSRLDDKRTGRIIAIQQRLHEDDISAHLSEKPGFHHLNLPAIAVEDEAVPLGRGRVYHRRIGEALNPRRESLEVLARLRTEMGQRAFEAQYQQNPVPPQSEYVRWNEVQFYAEAPDRGELRKVVISWDTASSIEPGADFSVGTVWGFDGEAWLLLDLIRKRMDYHELLSRVRLERSRWRADLILVENSSMGPALLADLSRDMRGLSDRQHRAPTCGRVAISPTLGKAERLYSALERLYSGLARLPRDAPWLADLRRELMAFPSGRYDDQVDSLSQFLNWAATGQGLAFARGRTFREDPPRRR